MQPSPVRDLIVGLFVALGLATIAYLSIQVGGVSYAGRGGLELHATFDQIGGLKPRARILAALRVVRRGRDHFRRRSFEPPLIGVVKLLNRSANALRTAGVRETMTTPNAQFPTPNLKFSRVLAVGSWECKLE